MDWVQGRGSGNHPALWGSLTWRLWLRLYQSRLPPCRGRGRMRSLGPTYFIVWQGLTRAYRNAGVGADNLYHSQKALPPGLEVLMWVEPRSGD